MRVFSYRNKLRLKRLLIVLVTLVVLAFLLVAGYYFYLQRYVVYTTDGAYLDLPWRQSESTETQTSPFVSGEIIWDSAATRETMPAQTEQVEAAPEIETAMRGYAVDPSELTSADTVLNAVDQDLAEAQEDGLESETEITVMITVKSNSGVFYYDSSLGDSASCASLTETLIEELSSRNVRLVALLPAFADSAYALANQNDGLPITGGALWMDENGCYWMNPTTDTAQNYLVSICQELRRMGFSEIVFTDFAFPESANIVFSSDYSRSELTAQVAQSVKEALSSTGLTLSFLTTDTESAFAAAESADRMYLQIDDGGQVSAAAALY